MFYSASYFAGLALAGTTLTGTVEASNATSFIPLHYTYNLPLPYSNGSNANGFINTVDGDPTVNQLFEKASTSQFIAYDPSFYDIFGRNPQLQLIAENESAIFYEAGAWVYDRGEVWFTGAISAGAAGISAFNLKTNKIYSPQTSTPVVNPNGGYYFNGLVYFTAEGNATHPASIVSINPSTGQTATVLNTYFGLPFNGPDDVAWLRVANNNYMFFSDPDYASVLSALGAPQLPNAVWRFDPQTTAIRPVISRADILEPNGVRGTADGRKLYVTDSVPRPGSGSPTQGLGGAGSNGTGSAAIYEFDVSADGLPGNKRLFGIARTGVPDGIHVDDYGRVWTAEGEGIVVRDAGGKVLGLVSVVPALPLHAVGNFALAGDVLVVLAGTELYTVRLAQTVVVPSRFHTA